MFDCLESYPQCYGESDSCQFLSFCHLLCLSSAVVYDGCPKAFDAGIWWPKTKFGRPAAIDCPKGSFGEICQVSFGTFQSRYTEVCGFVNNQAPRKPIIQGSVKQRNFSFVVLSFCYLRLFKQPIRSLPLEGRALM